MRQSHELFDAQLVLYSVAVFIKVYVNLLIINETLIYLKIYLFILSFVLMLFQTHKSTQPKLSCIKKYKKNIEKSSDNLM